jgi:hypothetical protein
MVLNQMSNKVMMNASLEQYPKAGPIAIPPHGLDVNYLVPVYVPAINLQSGGGGTTLPPGVDATTSQPGQNSGAMASLDETGYTTIAGLCDSAEMTMFVRRVIADIGCSITDEFGLTGFVPWYSGEADVQSFPRLDGELRCLCTRGQGPIWLQPTDPLNPPTGGLLRCTGRRCNHATL